MAGDAVKDENPIPRPIVEGLLEDTAPVHPAPERAQDMLARVKGRIHSAAKSLPPVTDLLTVAKADGEWVEPVPGNKIKMLRTDADTQSFLVRLEPGTRFPAHSHPEDEETLVLEGEVLFGDIQLHAGDYHLARKGSFHEEVYSEKGCLLFIRASTQQG